MILYLPLLILETGISRNCSKLKRLFIGDDSISDFAFPIGVMSAFYLEEFAPKSKVTDLIEVSINNLAAVPSIIYGLLGLAIYLQVMNLPRSSALVGGMTLSMLVLPVVIIATRNTINQFRKLSKMVQWH